MNDASEYVIFKSSAWNDVEDVNIQNISTISKESIFISTSSSEDEDAFFNTRHIKDHEELLIPTDNDVDNREIMEYATDEIISSSDEYIPTKSDIDNSDSNSCINVSEETSDGFTEVISKKHRRQKRKQKKLFQSASTDKVEHVLKAKPGVQQSDVLPDIIAVKQESLSAYRQRREISKVHSKRLDVLLKSNGLRRQHVPALGNCFFEAVAIQTSEKTSAAILRRELCQHIEQNSAYYKEFLNSAEVNLSDQLKLLCQEDCWQTSLSDAMPLAIANVLGVTVKIYSSHPDQPVVMVTPSLTETSEKEEITLAYLSVPGYEHYDSVIRRIIGLPSETDSELEMCNVSDSAINQADISIEVSNEVNSAEANDTPTKQERSSNAHKNITPRKQAKFQSPKSKRLSRKRKANPDSWKKNVRKLKCHSGMEYVGVTGKTVEARKIKQQACSKCRFSCADKVNEDDRLSLFNEYWNLKSYERQRDYISSRVLERDSVGSPSKKRKQVARTFTFIVSGKNVRVCKTFFTFTLGISRKTVETALKKKQNKGSPISDKRGKHNAHNRTPTEDLDVVRSHIESFPVVESHYARKDTNRKYLGPDLSIRKMYDLYRDECQNNNRKYVKEHVYRHLFCTEYNMSFHKPKKDQCMTCHNYNQKNESGIVDDETKENYSEHQRRKTRAREEKQKDKETAKKDKSYQAATFDLEAVLSTPCSLVSQVYYKRKLSCYNLSFYSLGDNKGTCFLWNETEGERGSCEVASCLHKYISSLPPYVRHITFYSDNCSGQNRNRFVATALLYSVSVSTQINIIDQKFLETGHTHMECDSMHAAVEHAKKKTSIYIPSQWDTVIHMARRNNPYVVIPLKFWDFLDFKTVQKHHYTNMEKNKNGAKVRWREIKQLQFRKESPNVIYYKYDFDSEFEEIACKVPKRGRQKLVDNIKVQSKYTERIPISEAKKADLLSLCESNVIPSDCAPFYRCLPTKKGKKDRLPEPDINEDENDSD